jgi:predicted ATP-binding protein involved in virulence
MKLKRTTITNLRVLAHEEFEFSPQFTLIVGVNGVGKSTVLDALRICASRILPSVTRSRAKAISFSVEDIRKGAMFLDVDLTFENDLQEFRYTRREWREKYVADDKENIERLMREIRESARLRDRERSMLRELEDSQAVSDIDYFLPSLRELKHSIGASNVAPNCIFFSTNRSVVSDAGVPKSRAAGEEASAYAEALNSRPLYLAQFADWVRVQGQLAVERPLSERHMDVLRSAVHHFLPNYDNLHSDNGDKSRLLIDKSGVTLDVRQLSDGERGLLALVLDLARRLSQANPRLSDPVKKGEAVVLVDELDLHLHPSWQRTVVERLTQVFPGCQFIATTHSPQIVAAVEPEQVLLLTTAGVIRPDRTLGMDSNWILRHLMEADDRPAGATEAIRSVEGMIKRGEFEKARSMIAEAKMKGLDLPEWSVLEARMARLQGLR